MFDYDIAYLGSGHSCWHGALTLAAAGKKVILMDHDLPGGTCTNYGCDAKILLDGPFEFVEGLARYEDVCVDHAGTIDWKRLMAYKKATPDSVCRVHSRHVEAERYGFYP